MKLLYIQEVHHFDDLYPTLKAYEILVIKIVHSETKSQVLSLQLKGCPHCFQQYHKVSDIFMKKIVLGYFDFKLPN